MWNSRKQGSGIFRRIFVLFAFILLLAVLATELYVTNTVRRNYIGNLEKQLLVEARLMSAVIPFRSARPIDELCRRFKETTGARVTIIAPDGRVLGDSDTDSTHMDNHARRPEIREAARKGAGKSVRFSHTLKEDLLYVADRVAAGPQIQGFIRLSVPLTEIDRSLSLLRGKIIVVVAMVLLATAVFSFWQLDRIRRLTGQIRDFARSVARGELGKKLFLERAGEFDEIADSLNAMSEELRDTQAASDEEKKRLNVILRSIPDALFIVDARGVILLSSVAARDLFPDAPFRGRPYIEVVRNTEFLALMEKARSEEAAAAAEIRLDAPAERFCVVRVSPLFYGDRELSGFIVIFHDITQLKKLEQTRKDFVANISHEIKTPVTAIRGFADTLLEGALDDREHAARFLRTIKANSERINSLVDDLMTISKIELGVITVEKGPVDVVDVVEQVLAVLRDKAAKKNLALETRLLPEFPVIAADRDRLIQILTNLTDNAVKFTDQGRITIGTAEENGKRLLFVEDTGIGVPQKHLARLGERFYRVDPGRSRSMGGTGLGLAIVKHLVKAHGWDLKIESTPGKGTTVKIVVA